jgi:hypothetical protein
MANSSSDDKIVIALIVFFANLTGSYLPPKLLDRIEADRLFVYVITSDTVESGFKFADTLREMNIAVSTLFVHDKHLNKTLQIHAYSQNKAQSHMIKSNIQENFKYHVVHLD